MLTNVRDEDLTAATAHWAGAISAAAVATTTAAASVESTAPTT